MEQMRNGLAERPTVLWYKFNQSAHVGYVNHMRINLDLISRCEVYCILICLDPEFPTTLA